MTGNAGTDPHASFPGGVGAGLGTSRFVEAGNLTATPPTWAPNRAMLAPAPLAPPPAPPAPPQMHPTAPPMAPPTADPPIRVGAVRPHIQRGVAAAGRSTRRGDIAITVLGVGLGISLGIGVASVKDGLDLPGGTTLAFGTLAALGGTYLCLVLLLLISRLPWLEREVGHDRMVTLHRKVAPYSLVLIAGHVVLTTVSYAQAAEHSVLGQFWTIVTKSAWMVPATVAFALMMSLGVMSYRRVRSKMKYETWWVAHLYFYVAVALSFGHQVVLGTMFVSHPAQRYFWTALYITVGLTILTSRVIAPIVTSTRHQLRVVSVVPEAYGVVSIYLAGRDLDLLKARGGQFFQWRFITRHWWWQSHPYSLSASPNPSWLRITVKNLGDQSAMLRQVRPGTRVWVEGPYGVFTAAARRGDRVTAFAAGVGITPIRAVLDDLPPTTDVTLVYRVSNAAGAPLRAEIDALAAQHGWHVFYLEGSRQLHPLTRQLVTSVAPGIARSDVYVCGPDSFTSSIVDAARDAGVPDRRIHHEAFSF